VKQRRQYSLAHREVSQAQERFGRDSFGFWYVSILNLLRKSDSYLFRSPKRRKTILWTGERLFQVSSAW
jgi:hypothetical protein